MEETGVAQGSAAMIEDSDASGGATSGRYRLARKLRSRIGVERSRGRGRPHSRKGSSRTDDEVGSGDEGEVDGKE